MTDLQARISGVVLNRLADYGIRIDRDVADSVAEAVTALPDVAIVDAAERSTGRHSLDDDLIEDGRYVMWFDHGTDCPWVGCAHGWFRSGRAAAIAAEVGQ